MPGSIRGRLSLLSAACRESILPSTDVIWRGALRNSIEIATNANHSQHFFVVENGLQPGGIVNAVSLARAHILRHFKPMQTSANHAPRRFSVAPMMEWTDRHCRFFHRLLTRRAVLYTEMITTGAVLRGNRARLLAYDPAEHPVAVQLGGSDPRALAESARICADLGYNEINLNVGCPSDRVQEGRFGACLMAEPALVGDCVAAMKAAVAIPVTVKCRIGIDEQDPEQVLPAFAAMAKRAGADALIVHARKA